MHVGEVYSVKSCLLSDLNFQILLSGVSRFEWGATASAGDGLGKVHLKDVVVNVFLWSKMFHGCGASFQGIRIK